MVCARNQEAVAWKEGTVVQKRQEAAVVEYYRGRHAAGTDLAEKAGGHPSIIPQTEASGTVACYD